MRNKVLARPSDVDTIDVGSLYRSGNLLRKSDLFAFRVFSESRVGRFVPVCRVDEVVAGRGKALEVEGLRIAVFNDSGRFHALLGRCPHANGALGFGWIEEGEVVCPLHRWQFKLETGRCTTVRGESVHQFRCEVRGEDVWVEV